MKHISEVIDDLMRKIRTERAEKKNLDKRQRRENKTAEKGEK